MKNLKQLITFATIIFSFSFIEVQPSLESLSFFAKAEAVVGRPLTPVSVAGVSRRTVRRCAAGVYTCKHKVITPSKLSTTQKG